MTNACCRLTPQTLIWFGLVFVYFVLYPRDLSALFAPVESLSSVAIALLQVTLSVSPWLYGFASVCVVAWTAVSITDRIFAKDRRTT